MNLKSLITLFSLLAFLTLPLSAKDDVPRGFKPLTELQEGQTKADGKKLIVLVVKGMNDSCPNCATTMDNGLKAVGSGIVKLFARAETIREMDQTDFPDTLKTRIAKGFTTGASVTFVVFTPDMTEIVAEGTRKELQNNKKATREFKTQVKTAKKALK